MSIMKHLTSIIIERARASERYIVAVAGPPGAGKSTVAEELCRLLPEGEATIVPMDGFHYDNAVLEKLGLRERKGAPETFDFPGFEVLLKRLRAKEPRIAIPLFDRTVELARAGACIVEQNIRFIIVEGNYLLLDEAPWSRLAALFDLRVFIEVQRRELERRLMRRWLDLGQSEQQARHWIETNDMPNVERVLRRRLPSDLTI
jgi:pantothenate kinase